MGAGPIPRSSAIAYAAEMGVESFDEFERFWAIIAEVDRFTLKLVNAGADKEDHVAADDAVGARRVMDRLQAKQKHHKKKPG